MRACVRKATTMIRFYFVCDFRVGHLQTPCTSTDLLAFADTREALFEILPSSVVLQFKCSPTQPPFSRQPRTHATPFCVPHHVFLKQTHTVHTQLHSACARGASLHPESSFEALVRQSKFYCLWLCPLCLLCRSTRSEALDSLLARRRFPAVTRFFCAHAHTLALRPSVQHHYFSRTPFNLVSVVLSPLTSRSPPIAPPPRPPPFETTTCLPPK